MKSMLRTWFLCLNWLSFSAFWETEKHVFHITPFRTTSYVQMRLKWLEVTNRVRNWNNVKNFDLVESKLELCQLEMLIFIYKLKCQSSLINLLSFLFCEFNRVTSWKEGKNIILERSSSLNPQKKYWFHFQGQRMSMWTCLFLIVILKETLVLMCLASHFDIIETWKVNVGHRYLYYAKNY